jgi:hypothetical protein
MVRYSRLVVLICKEKADFRSCQKYRVNSQFCQAKISKLVILHIVIIRTDVAFYFFVSDLSLAISFRIIGYRKLWFCSCYPIEIFLDFRNKLDSSI